MTGAGKRFASVPFSEMKQWNAIERDKAEKFAKIFQARTAKAV